MFKLMQKRRGLLLICLILAVVTVVFLVSGCGEKQASSTDQKQVSSTDQKQTTEVATKGSSDSKIFEILKKEKIRVGWAPQAPMVQLDPATNKVTGLYADVANDFASSLGVQIEWVESSWATMVTGLQGDLYDTTIMMGRTMGRAKQAEFTQGIVKNIFTLAVGKDSPYQKWQDLDQKGIKISVTQGSNTDECLTKIIKNAEIVRLKTASEAVLELQSGRVQGMATLASYFYQNVDQWPELRILNDQFGAAINSMAVPQGDQLFLNVMNLFLSDYKANGGVEKLIKEKYKLKGIEACPVYY